MNKITKNKKKTLRLRFTFFRYELISFRSRSIFFQKKYILFRITILKNTKNYKKLQSVKTLQKFITKTIEFLFKQGQTLCTEKLKTIVDEKAMTAYLSHCYSH